MKGRSRPSESIRLVQKNDFGPAILKNYSNVTGWDFWLVIGVVAHPA